VSTATWLYAKEYPSQMNSLPGRHALRAYDAEGLDITHLEYARLARYS